MNIALKEALIDLFGDSIVTAPKYEKIERPKDIALDEALNDLFGTAQKEIEKSVPVEENFPLHEKMIQERARRGYMMSEDYTRVKVRHWKEEYILPEITNPVAVGLYALFRAYHAEIGYFSLSLDTSYVYLREDTGEFINAEEFRNLGRDVHTRKISYGLRELYRRSGGGGADWTGCQLILALEQLIEAGYLVYNGMGYMASEKQPERLYNADEFLSLSKDAGIVVSFSSTGSLILKGENEEVKQRLQYMLEYSRSLGVPDTLRCTVIARLKGCPVFYDNP